MGEIRVTDEHGLVLSIDRDHEYLRSKIRMSHQIVEIARKLTSRPHDPEYTLDDKMDDEFANREIERDEAREIEKERRDYIRDSI